MLYSYFKMACRTLTRNKVYAAINILGLAVGIASCILIYLYVQDELQYDRHFKDSERVYRVLTEVNKAGQQRQLAVSPGLLAPTLAEDYPEVEQVTRFLSMGRNALLAGQQAFYAENFIYADSNVFSVLAFPFVAGNAATALKAPGSVVITEQLAQKMFGGAEAALGKTVQFIAAPFTVTGVFKQNQASHFKPDVFVPLHWDEYTSYLVTNWEPFGIYTYVKLHEQAQATSLQNKFAALYTSKIKPAYSPDGTSSMQLALQPLTNAYFDQESEVPVGEVGNKNFIYIFTMVAAFILLIATINYINLATARSAKRAKEVGLRKTIGANQSQLIQQFLFESLLLSLISVVLAVAMVELLLPVFNQFTGKQIGISFLLTPAFALTALGIVCFVGLMAGSYPAFVLARYEPSKVLKVNSTPANGHATLRKLLVVVQFTISLVLLIGTVVVYSQMQYLRNTNLGFNKEQVLSVAIPSIGWVKQKENLAKVKQDLLALPQVKQTSHSGHLPGQFIPKAEFNFKVNQQLVPQTVNVFGADFNYLNLMEIPLVAGRNFFPEMKTDQGTAVLINEAAAKGAGWTDPIGKRISLATPGGDTLQYNVVGVVQDYHYTSLHSKIEPLLINLSPDFGNLVIRLNTSVHLSATLQQLEKVWQVHFPGYPMEYQFLDEIFQKQYQAEEKMLVIFGYFTVLAMVVACLGLFGLAAFMAEQRTKEIGIRKVMGSSVAGIVLLLSRNFAELMLLSIVLACPLAWYGMHNWLQDFAYRTELNPLIFAVAGLCALALAMAAVSYQALKAATADPVQALRTE